MSVLFDLIYLLAFVGSLPLLVWRRIRWGKNRRGWGSKLWGAGARLQPAPRRVWFHAVSVGEVNLLAPLIAAIESSHPDWDVVLSTSTETGFDVARQKYPHRHVFFCPWDFSWAVRRAIDRINPHDLILAELELWPNLLRLAAKRGVRLGIVNGRLSDRSFRRYRLLRWVFGPMLRRLDFIAAQTDEYAARFVALGASPARVQVVGNLKFDGALSSSSNSAGDRLPAQFGLTDADWVLVAGSTQPEEDAMAIEVYNQLRREIPDLRLVLAPRHPTNAPRAIRKLEQAGLAYHVRSLGPPAPADIGSRERPVVVIDVLGELSTWWRRADLAYVGGSQGTRGGQNMIEPAAHGAAVSFGPRTENFRDVVRLLLNDQAAEVVADTASLAHWVRRLSQDRQGARDFGARAQRVVAAHRGATAKTLQLLSNR